MKTQRIYDEDRDAEFEILREIPLPVQVEGRTVIMTEDILDTGISMRDLVQHFKDNAATEVIIAVLIKRDGVERGEDMPEAKHICFTINTDSWFIGSGLDDKRIVIGSAEFLPTGLLNDGGRSWPGIWANRPPSSGNEDFSKSD
jgi:hypoxanthine-guanine phosphoribosyltransferase